MTSKRKFDKQVWLRLVNLPDAEKRERTMECPTCKGDGIEHYSSRRYKPLPSSACYTCGGHGTVTPLRYRMWYEVRFYNHSAMLPPMKDGKIDWIVPVGKKRKEGSSSE